MFSQFYIVAWVNAMTNVLTYRKTLISSLIIPMLACLFNVFLLMYPREVLNAAREGLGLWFNNVLPSMLPFIIGTNILTGMGFAHFLGMLLSPVVTPLFNVPGAGGFALITGLTSGYPIGAKVTATLRRNGQLTQAEAQRLVGFCNNAGPLFIVGVAGTGLFGSAAAGYVLWASHVAAALVTGLLFRFYKSEEKTQSISGGVIRRAFAEYRAYRRENDCAFGHVLGESVSNAMESVVLIGGFIIFFCVVVRVVTVTGLLDALIPGSANDGVITGALTGILEVTNGVKALAQNQSASLPLRLAVSAGVIGFGGLSIHAQTLHFIRDTGIKIGPYIGAKILHALLAVVFFLLIHTIVV